MAGLQRQELDAPLASGCLTTMLADSATTVDIVDQVSWAMRASISHEADVAVGLLLGNKFAGKVLVSVVIGQ